jgi:multiple sugar transport system ATP-binding protein
MTIGDRIAVLDDGRLQQVGTPMTCYHEPANRFVASFIGEPSMNLLDCEFDRTADAFTGAVEYPAGDRLATAATDAAGTRVTLGFRPEAPTLVGPDETDGSDAVPAFPGRVDVVEPVGERSFVYVTLDAGPQLTVAAPGGTPVRERATVRVRLPDDAAHLFDGETGEALVHPDWSEDSTVAGVTAGPES